MTWLNNRIKPLDTSAQQAAIERQQQLTKPLGALGQLEDIAISLAAMQGGAPQLNKVAICVFAADHGIAASGVSAYPQEVTAQMIANFINGGAAISVLAKRLGASLEIINLGTVTDTTFDAVNNEVIARGTNNILVEPAMSESQCQLALDIGRKYLLKNKESGCDLFVAGEMGIANTSAATVIAAALSEYSIGELTGPGTGLDSQGVARKVALLEQVSARHLSGESTPLAILRNVGGFEIAALVGSYISAAQEGIAILVDGFICTAAAMMAVAIAPSCRQWMLFSHGSAESGHQLMLSHLNATPILDLQMRLGEGSGAAVCVPVIEMACQLHNNMATFDEAAVAGKTNDAG